MVGQKRFNLFDSINIIILVLIACSTILPLIYITAISLSDTASVTQGKVFLWPRGLNLDAYVQVLKDAKIPRAYLNTIMYTSLGTFINVFLTCLAAYPLAQREFVGRKIWMFMIVLTMFLNPGIIPNYLIVKELNLLDSVWALVIPNAIWTFQLIILKSFFENSSESIREAAKVDGASEYRILFSMMIPLSKPALASIALFYFIGHWNSYFIPMIYLNTDSLYPLQVVLRQMLVFSETGGANLVEASALAPQAKKNATIVLAMIPVLLVYPFAQKYFARGVMLGSEKG